MLLQDTGLLPGPAARGAGAPLLSPFTNTSESGVRTLPIRSLVPLSSPPAPMATLQLNHIARETADVRGLAAFYEEVLGFERVPSPNYSGFQVAWLRLPGTPGVALHIIERDPAAAASPGAAGAPPAQLPRRHHVAFSVVDYDGFLSGLKARGTDVFEKTQPNGRTRQVFFFDPDGNGLEVTSSTTNDK